MAFDGIFLHCLVSDLKEKLINNKIDKINQPEKDEILISIRGVKKEKLLISSSSNYARIHFTTETKTNPIKAPMFCMVLRKYLTGGKILNITQPSNDRILHIDIESSDELGFNSIYTLIVEIMGRHSNISLVRKRDNKIMESIKHITSFVNSYRTLLPNVIYIEPPKSTKLNPFHFNLENFKSLISDIDLNETCFSKIFNGISKPLSLEIFNNINKENLNTEEKIFIYLKEYFNNLLDSKQFALYYKEGELKDFYSIPINIYENYNKEIFDNPSLMLDTYYYKKDKQDRLHNRSSDLQKLITTNIDRCLKKEKILNKTLKECSEKEKLRIYGDLLTSYIYTIKKGDKNINLVNFYSEEGESLTIPLDENKTPSENIQRYYKKYNKLKKSEESALEQLDKNIEELDYLNSVLTNLKSIENYTEIEEIKEELITSHYIKHRKKSNKKAKASKPMHFKSSEGYDIFVGKNNFQNDYLTLKFADKMDTWLHTKNIPGSHVIIKGRNIPDKTLEEAATLAAFYSKGKNSTKIPVDYTEIRHVKKPSGAKPGMVIYATNKTIYIDPYEIDLERID